MIDINERSHAPEKSGNRIIETSLKNLAIIYSWPSSKVAANNTPLFNYYDWTKVISEISSKFMKYIATIFEHNFYTYFFRKCYEEVDLKKVIIIFLNLATFAFSTSVFHIMCKSSYGSLYKTNKYKRIKSVPFMSRAPVLSVPFKSRAPVPSVPFTSRAHVPSVPFTSVSEKLKKKKDLSNNINCFDCFSIVLLEIALATRLIFNNQ